MKKNNLVLFPNVDKQLVEKGLAFMQEKNFQEALHIFEELEALGLATDSSRFANIVCLYELGNYEEALVIAEELVEKNHYQDFQIAQFYMTILVQLNQYEKLEKVAKILENQTFLTEEMKSQLRSLQNFSKKATIRKSNQVNNDWYNLLYHSMSLEQVLVYLQNLTNSEYESNKDVFQNFLVDESGSYLLKTFILEKLKDLHISETVKVQKFSQTFLFHPVESPALFETDFYVRVYNLLDQKLGNDNPSLFHVVVEYADQLFMAYYPLMPKNEETVLFAAALHCIGYSFHGIDIAVEELEELYGIIGNDLQSKIEEIQNLERKYILTT